MENNTIIKRKVGRPKKIITTKEQDKIINKDSNKNEKDKIKKAIIVNFADF